MDEYRKDAIYIKKANVHKMQIEIPSELFYCQMNYGKKL